MKMTETPSKTTLLPTTKSPTTSSPMTSSSSGFHAFKLDQRLLKAIDDAGYTEPRRIQVETIGHARDGRDILGLAQTGTGKTAAFVLPILDRLITDRRSGGPQALVVAPTRELALQIEREFLLLGKYLNLRTATIFGGVSSRAQIDAVRGKLDVIIACPGRLLDLMRQGHVSLATIRTLVLDEADQMFDMGFLPDIRRILAALPKERQNLLFSATMPEEIRQLADSLLHTPHVVELASTAPAELIEHALYQVEEGNKYSLLETVLSGNDFASAIIFSRTKHRAKRLATQLIKNGHRATALQGNMSQAQRNRAMDGFRERKFDILVATDIVARGIDVAKVSHVINYDVPVTPIAYVHRIGRTGRAETSGKAFTFVTSDDRGLVRAIERTIGKSIQRCTVDGTVCTTTTTESLPKEERSFNPRRRVRHHTTSTSKRTHTTTHTTARPHSRNNFRRNAPKHSSAAL